VNKPRDMLEFFRRAAPGDVDAPPPPPALEPTTRMLVLRRSQAVVAIVAAAAALLLAFLLGHAVGASGGGEGAQPAPGMFVIRAATYKGDQRMDFARSMKQQLEKMDLGDEVQVLEVPSESSTVVAVGSWFSSPEERKEARALRDKLRGMKDSTQATPFSDADFWRMKR